MKRISFVSSRIILLLLCLSICISIEAADESSVCVCFFYSPDCEECHEIKNSYLPILSEKYSSLEVKTFDISNIEDYQLMLRLEKRHGEIKNPPPTIFIDGQILDGEEEIKEKLEEMIKLAFLKGGSSWTQPAEKNEIEKSNCALVTDKFKQLGIFSVIGGGLLDGINPCAFTTIIFLISYLNFIKRKKKEILFIGAVFTLAVFITYLSIGIGLFEFIKRISLLPTLSRILSFLVAGIAFLLAIFSLYDYWKIKQGKIREIRLQLPRFLKDKIHAVIRKESNVKHYILATFIIGFLVSLLEFPCTGQIYLPIIVVVREISALRIQALFYLILYNLMFILPLIVVFGFAYWGTTWEGLSKVMYRHVGMVKIFSAVLFFVLATMLLISISTFC